jgi:hypothetical protein
MRQGGRKGGRKGGNEESKKIEIEANDNNERKNK